MSRTTNNLLLSISLMLYMPAGLAERTDSEKPLHLESDQVLIDDANNISTFTGNVQLSQGTMLIRGDKIVVKRDKNGFNLGTIYGNTASFRQKREGFDEYVEGSGQRIEYDTRTEVINLYVQARIKRGLDDVRGEHITYNIKTEVFQVSGGASSADAPPKRVRAVLQPKPKKDSTAPPAPDVPPNNPAITPLPAK